MDKYQLKLTNSQFATEHMIHDRLLNSYLRTDNPQEADFFFVPLFPMGIVYKYKKVSDSEKQRLLDSISSYIPSKLRSTACTGDRYDEKWCKRLKYQAGVLKYALSLLNHWHIENSGGTRHIFIFPGGDQQNMFQNWREEIGQSVHLLVEGYYGSNLQTEEHKKFAQHRAEMDIIIPGGGDYDTMYSNKIERKRTVFLSYCGHTYGSRERERALVFIKLLRQHGKKVIFQETCTKKQFLRNLQISRYCLAPAGSTPWTARLYGSIAQLCIPVLFNKDLFAVPYRLEEIFSSMSVRFSSTQRPEMSVMELLSNEYEKTYNYLHAARDKFSLNHSIPELHRELSRIKCKN